MDKVKLARDLKLPHRFLFGENVNPDPELERSWKRWIGRKRVSMKVSIDNSNEVFRVKLMNLIH